MTYQIPETVRAGRSRVFVHVLDSGERVVVKQDNEPRGRILHLLQRVAYRLTGAPLLAPTVLAPDVSRATFEAGVLRRYGALGLPVPKVLYEDPSYLVLSHEGEPLESFLRDNPRSARSQDLIAEALAALRALHEKGHAHGGAQIRNFLVRQDGRIVLIDFEENTGSAPLEHMKLRDLLQFLISLSKRDSQLDPVAVCSIYDASGRSAERLGSILARYRILKIVNRKPFLRFRMKDVRALVTLIEKLA
ncbi:hypothetical protein IHV25_09495 [Phaeovibrio sulfidiphilus]|uniref:Mn2+-dependent serine/threonine protein kinase n=1 Tax=Phaeovibrio sulfidiphilus TaxID=1220600 RepID=A0A8J7CRX4_9PROT|nr:lipopolysaccharide kinase InaA family protein [Phaeovibrio sulfidiphilus]MBE1237875.1 hypothetical protein [Phaeovibrio sulfidiphilus]